MQHTIDIIRALRAVPLSQSEIAARTGIPQPRISRWESGQVPKSVDDALVLLDLLNSCGANCPAGQVDAAKTNEPNHPVTLDAQAVCAIDTEVV